MLVSVLASGSEGNSTYVETEDAKILIDAGMNTKYLKTKLSELEVDTKEIDYVIMTHTHHDHTGALKTFLKRNPAKLVATENMLKELEDIKDYENIIINPDSLEIGKTTVKPFKTSHDAIDSRGYLIEDKTSSLVYMTDTGYLNQKYFEMLSNKNIYIMEANHDVEMLINGSYPKWLKSRILSDHGHLSNNAAGFYLSKLIGPNTKKVILAHLSKENNTEDEAVRTVKKTLKEYEIDFEDIIVAKQRDKTEGIKA
ncbi:MAG TPA: MBL fold metallo-hydrolase [Firmicutes bacterium]|nr:MBL fold metallo-hydrolase [Bacillota bacterium]